MTWPVPTEQMPAAVAGGALSRKSVATTPMIGLDTNVPIRYLTQDDLPNSARYIRNLKARVFARIIIDRCCGSAFCRYFTYSAMETD